MEQTSGDRHHRPPGGAAGSPVKASNRLAFILKYNELKTFKIFATVLSSFGVGMKYCLGAPKVIKVKVAAMMKVVEAPGIFSAGSRCCCSWSRWAAQGWTCVTLMTWTQQQIRQQKDRTSWFPLTVHLTTCPSKLRAVMKTLMRTVKKTKTLATLFILSSLACFLRSLRSNFTAGTN